MLQLLAKKKISRVKIYKIIPKINSHTTQKSLLKAPILIYFILCSRQVGMFELHHAPFQEKHKVLLQRGSQHYASFQVEYKVLLQRGHKFCAEFYTHNKIYLYIYKRWSSKNPSAKCQQV